MHPRRSEYINDKKNSRVDSIYILDDEDQVKLMVPPSNKENLPSPDAR